MLAAGINLVLRNLAIIMKFLVNQSKRLSLFIVLDLFICLCMNVNVIFIKNVYMYIMHHNTLMPILLN